MLELEGLSVIHLQHLPSRQRCDQKLTLGGRRVIKKQAIPHLSLTQITPPQQSVEGVFLSLELVLIY